MVTHFVEEPAGRVWQRSRMVLDTTRLMLRPLVRGDAEGLHTCFGDAEAMRFWDAAPARDVAETAKRLEETLTTDPRWHAGWAVVLKETGQFIGFVNYHNRVPQAQRLAVGYILAAAYWRRGLMTEAMRCFIGHCFSALDAHRIEALIEPENVASMHLAERLGFRREGLLRDRLRVAGRYRSVEMLSLLEEDWRG
jgi:ribosomal-protein-alanine N-acetyltransferase